MADGAAARGGGPDTDGASAHRFSGKASAARLVSTPALARRIAEQAERRGDARCITVVGRDGKASGELSYRELDVRSARLAAWLRDRHELRPGAVVGLMPVNDLASVLAYFALLRSGCPVLVLNPRDPAARIAAQTGALAPRLLLCSPEAEVDEAVDVVRLPEPRTLREPARPWTDPELEPDGDALYFGTSGSTAASKLVAQSHYNGAVNAEALRRLHGLGPGDRILGCLPIHHVNGVHFTLLAPFAAGAHAVLAPGFDLFGYPALLERFRPRIASVVPSILEALVEVWRGASAPAGLDYFVSAAAPLTAGTARAVGSRLGVRVLQGYGLTETTNFSTTMPPGLPEELYQRLMVDTDIPSVGVSVFGNEVAVLGPDGSRLPAGTVGEVCMRGHNVMNGYAGNPDATAEAFAGGWFHSQDLGFEVRDDSTGQGFFVLTGRTKNIAKVRGESVSLEEMERVLRAVPGVRDAACAAVREHLVGETVVAALVAPPDLVPDAVVLERLAGAFDPAVLPTRLIRLERVPRTPTGKLLRPDLADLLGGA